MSTAVATLETRSPAMLTPWAAWDEKMRFAKELVGTGFCPSAIKTPAQALAVILTGQELGIPPMHALRSIHVIQGKPTLSAELMLALMLKGGVSLAWGECSDLTATLTAKRATTAYTGTFTLEEAKRANLTNKDGWRNYPAAMLRARVIALTARVVAPDLIAGMYTAEELGADVDAEGTIVRAPKVVETEPVPPAFAAAETEPESGRQETLSHNGSAPSHDWLIAFGDASTVKALQHLWKGCTAPDVWGSFTASEQETLTAAKDAAKARLAGLAA